MERAATVRSKALATRSPLIVRQIARVAGDHPPLPVRQLLAGGFGVFRRRLAQEGELHVAAGRDVASSCQIQPEEFVALLQVGILDGDLGQAIRMRIEQLRLGP